MDFIDSLFSVDWNGMLVPDVPLLEIVIRGSVMFLAIFLMMRFILRREAGGLGMSDVLVVVLLADAAQNGMAGEYKSIPDGILLVLVIIGWNYTFQQVALRFPSVRRILHPPPLPLVQDGRINRRNMRHELITEEELQGQLRLQGVEDMKQVKQAFMEADGQISVVKDGGDGRGKPKRKAH